MCLSHLLFLVIFEALSWRFSWSDFEAFLFGIWWGCMHELEEYLGPLSGFW
jgi:hypothetical protein